jgi:pimeloyl-ACP methyl ester carboxylesterase
VRVLRPVWPPWRAITWAAGCLTRVVAAVAVMAAVTLTTAAGGPAAGQAEGSSPPVPSLRWRACDGGYQCATARVPLDYRHPRGRTISIAVIRHLATGPARRIGSLFFNAGGPGTPGTLLPLLYGQLPAQVRARFDIVSFDSRGVGESTSFHCFPTDTAEQRFLAPLPAGFPVGSRQQALTERIWAQFDARCARSNLSLLDHMSTADVARDMNLLRQAVGDPVLNYLGLSYGTILGATYANLFPSRVGAMVLDGNVDPVAYAVGSGTLPTFLRSGSDQASAATLNAFLTMCGQAATADCAFSAGSPTATRAKFATLLRRLLQQPVTLGPPAQVYTYASTIDFVVNDILYTTVADPPLGAGWPADASLLQQIWTASATAGPPSQVQPTPTAAAGANIPYLPPEQRIAVICADSPNPRRAAAYPADARLAEARSASVGPDLAWRTESCASWPASAAQDRYTGPWNRPTAHTILLIGNTGDPATPYWGSLAMARDLARARLLTIDGYGHTEFGNKSACGQHYESAYLLAGSLPPPGATCPGTEPFRAAGGQA